MAREASSARLAALVGSTLLGLGAAGCERGHGQRFECNCRFLTDRDDLSAQAVEICAQASEAATTEARGCAQSAAPGPVQSCACRPVASGGSCALGECRAHD
jgi:hypothetical protein